ncbi:hypothetical protein GJAV_G00151120 [Gymnothorax javanicus]|nr:hypothetical protein GJAV_G00151120 [Gymnothorax javanicus]
MDLRGERQFYTSGCGSTGSHRRSLELRSNVEVESSSRESNSICSTLPPEADNGLLERLKQREEGNDHFAEDSVRMVCPDLYPH